MTTTLPNHEARILRDFEDALERHVQAIALSIKTSTILTWKALSQRNDEVLNKLNAFFRAQKIFFSGTSYEDLLAGPRDMAIQIATERMKLDAVARMKETRIADWKADGVKRIHEYMREEVDPAINFLTQLFTLKDEEEQEVERAKGDARLAKLAKKTVLKKKCRVANDAVVGTLRWLDKLKEKHERDGAVGTAIGAKLGALGAAKKLKASMHQQLLEEEKNKEVTSWSASHGKMLQGYEGGSTVHSADEALEGDGHGANSVAGRIGRRLHRQAAVSDRARTCVGESHEPRSGSSSSEGEQEASPKKRWWMQGRDFIEEVETVRPVDVVEERKKVVTADEEATSKEYAAVVRERLRKILKSKSKDVLKMVKTVAAFSSTIKATASPTTPSISNDANAVTSSAPSGDTAPQSDDKKKFKIGREETKEDEKLEEQPEPITATKKARNEKEEKEGDAAEIIVHEMQEHLEETAGEQEREESHVVNNVLMITHPLTARVARQEGIIPLAVGNNYSSDQLMTPERAEEIRQEHLRLRHEQRQRHSVKFAAQAIMAVKKLALPVLHAASATSEDAEQKAKEEEQKKALPPFYSIKDTDFLRKHKIPFFDGIPQSPSEIASSVADWLARHLIFDAYNTCQVRYKPTQLRLMLLKGKCFLQHLAAQLSNNSAVWLSSREANNGPPVQMRVLHQANPKTFGDSLFAIFLYTVGCNDCHCGSDLGACMNLVRQEWNTMLKDKGFDDERHPRPAIHPPDPEAQGRYIAPWAIMNWSYRTRLQGHTLDIKAAARLASKVYEYYEGALSRALRAIPTTRTTLFRGIRGSVAFPYLPGDEIVWPSFSSTSFDGKIAQMFMGKNTGTFFIAHCHSARIIEWCSWFPHQAEALLPRNVMFQVQGRLSNTLLAMLNSRAEIISMVELGDTERLSSKELAQIAIDASKRTTFIFYNFVAKYLPGWLSPTQQGSSSLSIQLEEMIKAILHGGIPKADEFNVLTREKYEKKATSCSDEVDNILSITPDNEKEKNTAEADASIQIGSTQMVLRNPITSGEESNPRGKKVPSYNGAQYLEKYNVIIGGGGTGKTSSMLYILSEFMTIKQEKNIYFPIFVSLPATKFTRFEGVQADMLTNLHLSAEDFEELCTMKRVIILLDSLDEVDFSSVMKHKARNSDEDDNRSGGQQEETAGGVNTTGNRDYDENIRRSVQHFMLRNPLFGYLADKIYCFVLSSRDEFLIAHNISAKEIFGIGNSLWTSTLFVRPFSDTNIDEYVHKIALHYIRQKNTQEQKKVRSSELQQMVLKEAQRVMKLLRDDFKVIEHMSNPFISYMVLKTLYHAGSKLSQMAEVIQERGKKVAHVVQQRSFIFGLTVYDLYEAYFQHLFHEEKLNFMKNGKKTENPDLRERDSEVIAVTMLCRAVFQGPLSQYAPLCQSTKGIIGLPLRVENAYLKPLSVQSSTYKSATSAASENNDSTISFRHKSLQEFLVARAIYHYLIAPGRYRDEEQKEGLTGEDIRKMESVIVGDLGFTVKLDHEKGKDVDFSYRRDILGKIGFLSQNPSILRMLCQKIKHTVERTYMVQKVLVDLIICEKKKMEQRQKEQGDNSIKSPLIDRAGHEASSRNINAWLAREQSFSPGGRPTVSSFDDQHKLSLMWDEVRISNALSILSYIDFAFRTFMPPSTLSGLTISHAQLDGANLSGLDLSRTRFNYCSMRGVNLSSANVSNLIVNHCDFLELPSIAIGHGKAMVMDVSPCGKYLAVGGQMPGARIYDVVSMKLICVIQPRSKQVFCVRFQPSGEYFCCTALCENEAGVILFDPDYYSGRVELLVVPMRKIIDIALQQNSDYSSNTSTIMSLMRSFSPEDSSSQIVFPAIQVAAAWHPEKDEDILRNSATDIHFGFEEKPFALLAGDDRFTQPKCGTLVSLPSGKVRAILMLPDLHSGETVSTSCYLPQDLVLMATSKSIIFRYLVENPSTAFHVSNAFKSGRTAYPGPTYPFQSFDFSRLFGEFQLCHISYSQLHHQVLFGCQNVVHPVHMKKLDAIFQGKITNPLNRTELKKTAYPFAGNVRDSVRYRFGIGGREEKFVVSIGQALMVYDYVSGGLITSLDVDTSCVTLNPNEDMVFFAVYENQQSEESASPLLQKSAASFVKPTPTDSNSTTGQLCNSKVFAVKLTTSLNATAGGSESASAQYRASETQTSHFTAKGNVTVSGGVGAILATTGLNEKSLSFNDMVGFARVNTDDGDEQDIKLKVADANELNCLTFVGGLNGMLCAILPTAASVKFEHKLMGGITDIRLSRCAELIFVQTQVNALPGSYLYIFSRQDFTLRFCQSSSFPPEIESSPYGNFVLFSSEFSNSLFTIVEVEKLASKSFMPYLSVSTSTMAGRTVAGAAVEASAHRCGLAAATLGSCPPLPVLCAFVNPKPSSAENGTKLWPWAWCLTWSQDEHTGQQKIYTAISEGNTEQAEGSNVAIKSFTDVANAVSTTIYVISLQQNTKLSPRHPSSSISPSSTSMMSREHPSLNIEKSEELYHFEQEVVREIKLVKSDEKSDGDDFYIIGRTCQRMKYWSLKKQSVEGRIFVLSVKSKALLFCSPTPTFGPQPRITPPLSSKNLDSSTVVPSQSGNIVPATKDVLFPADPSYFLHCDSIGRVRLIQLHSWLGRKAHSFSEGELPRGQKGEKTDHENNISSCLSITQCAYLRQPRSISGIGDHVESYVNRPIWAFSSRAVDQDRDVVPSSESVVGEQPSPLRKYGSIRQDHRGVGDAFAVVDGSEGISILFCHHMHDMLDQISKKTKNKQSLNEQEECSTRMESDDDGKFHDALVECEKRKYFVKISHQISTALTSVVVTPSSMVPTIHEEERKIEEKILPSSPTNLPALKKGLKKVGMCTTAIISTKGRKDTKPKSDEVKKDNAPVRGESPIEPTPNNTWLDLGELSQGTAPMDTHVAVRTKCWKLYCGCNHSMVKIFLIVTSQSSSTSMQGESGDNAWYAQLFCLEDFGPVSHIKGKMCTGWWGITSEHLGIEGHGEDRNSIATERPSVFLDQSGIVPPALGRLTTSLATNRKMDYTGNCLLQILGARGVRLPQSIRAEMQGNVQSHVPDPMHLSISNKLPQPSLDPLSATYSGGVKNLSFSSSSHLSSPSKSMVLPGKKKRNQLEPLAADQHPHSPSPTPHANETPTKPSTDKKQHSKHLRRHGHKK